MPTWLDAWDHKLMGLALHIGGWSKDPSTQVGAVLRGGDVRQIAIGYNGFPPGIADTAERLHDREVKYKLVQHAERNALDNCFFDAAGGTLYVTRHPCSDCAKSIVSRRIARVVYLVHLEYEARCAADIAWSKLLLNEAQVLLLPYYPPKESCDANTLEGISTTKVFFVGLT